MRYNSIAEMKTSSIIVGSKLKIYGYYTTGDANYIVVASGTGTDDGGSYVTLNSSLQAKLICGNGVDCKIFCAKHGMIHAKSEKIFDSWTNYVNTTKGKYFEPSPIDGGYELFKPLYIRKSFIGEGDNIRFFYKAETVEKLPVSTT